MNEKKIIHDLVQSALNEIQKNGVLGLRIVDVAKGANCSNTQIYRYFGDKNGLIAAALGRVFEKILVDELNLFHQKLKTDSPLCVDDVVAALATPHSRATKRDTIMRLQILAVASTVPELEEKLRVITHEHNQRITESIAEVIARLPSDTKIDLRVLMYERRLQMPYYAQILGDNYPDEESYRKWLKDSLFPGSR